MFDKIAIKLIIKQKTTKKHGKITNKTGKTTGKTLGKKTMKTMKYCINNKKAYSLIELLVALSILGILTGIAIPSYRRYSRSAKSVEAKVSLGQIYMAEKHFFIQWRFYTHDLHVAGVAPEGELIYNAGFKNSASYPVSASDVPQYQGASISYTDNKVKSFFGLCGKSIGGSTKLKSCGFTNDDTPSGFTPPKIPNLSHISRTTFKAVAIGDLKNNKPKNTSTKDKDIWSITHFRKVKHEQDGS